MNNQINTLNFDTLKNFVAAKDIVSRKNQDGTVIIMKLDDSNIFYKITDVAALAWAFAQTPVEFNQIYKALSETYPASLEAQIQKDLKCFIEELFSKKLLVHTDHTTQVDKASAAIPDLTAATAGAYAFGALKEFNLEQIETEVLNDSIYLDVFAGSDLALKQDIQPLKNSLQKISNLSGVSFKWNKDLGQSAADQAGLIAQEVSIEMPELVRKDSATGHLAVNYTKMIPYLVESIKDLKALVESQNNSISSLREELSVLKNKNFRE